MCGIWAIIYLLKSSNEKLLKDFMNVKHRGPDISSLHVFKNVAIGFHRLAIMDLSFNANQPFIINNGEKTIIFICNGEIYNYKELIEEFNLNITGDCMTIPSIYIKMDNINKFVELFKNKIKGEFAFILFEFDKFKNLNQLVVGRDMVGIRPLYMSNINNHIMFSSEIKGMKSLEDKVYEFQPGNILNIKFNDFGLINENTYYDFKTIYNTNTLEVSKFEPDLYYSSLEKQLLENIRNAVINSVKRRLVSDRPVAFLLSGGVDSSLVVGIASKILGYPIKTYCCGMNEGTDLKHARMVAEYCNTNHTEVLFTPEEGLEVIKDVIYTTETWDTTTVRASVGQYLVCRHIGMKTDAKVVLVGEGPDEVCSSYLFNFNAPNGRALHETAKEYVEKIHMFDGKRADRCISRWGLEGRIPLLDPEFIEAYWMIPAEWRHPKYKGIEKWWLRKAFEGMGVLPDQVLWRKKEAFSDGVSDKTKSWFEIIQDHIKMQVTEIKDDSPTLEAYYYKKLFIEYFGENRLNIIPHYWQPKWTNITGYVDPSARTLDVYND